MIKIHGSIVALITPFRDGAVDEDALRRIVKWQVENGTDCICPTGTTGECPTLTKEEHCRVMRITVETVKECGGKATVLAGAGSNNPVESVYYTNMAEKYGADAVLHNAGYYNRPNQAGLYEHFKYVHDNTNLPIIVYNVPGRTVVDIKSDTLARLAELPRVIGVKDATGDLERPWVEHNMIHRSDFAWLSGNDSTAVSFNVAGGCGCVSVTANCAPALLSKMQKLMAEGKWEEARDIQYTLMPLHKLMFKEPSPAGAKYAASLLGLCTPECRLPILPLSEETRKEIRAEMEKLHLI